MEKWEIEISEDKTTFVFTRYIDGKVDEAYSPVKADKAAIYCAAVIHGYEPPRILLCRAKPSD